MYALCKVIAVMTLLGRNYPEISCDRVFSKQEWQALSLAVKKIFQKYPPIGQAMDMVRALGGHVKTKSNPFPGFEALWRGLMRLRDIEWGIEIATEYFSRESTEL